MNIPMLETLIDLEADMKKKQLQLKCIMDRKVVCELPNGDFVVSEYSQKMKKLDIKRVELEIELIKVNIESIKFCNKIE